jgi:hypothetical protein
LVRLLGKYQFGILEQSAQRQKRHVKPHGEEALCGKGRALASALGKIGQRPESLNNGEATASNPK